MVKKEVTYSEMKQQLEQLIQQLSDDSIDVDEALDLHKKAQDLVKKLEYYLNDISEATKK